MGFGNIGLLIGMALGVVPIIIHLINRRRAKLRRFAAIEFLLMSDKRLARRLKLKQILVLALRVLLVMALAFALAKPYIEPDVATVGELSEPGAVALVIDDSASMQAIDEGGDSRLERAVARARQFIESGGTRTSFAIIAMGHPARLLTPGLTYDHAVATRALEQLRPSGRGADLEGALAEAGRVLSESGERERRLEVLSDLAAHAWKPLPTGWGWVPVSTFAREPLDVEARQGTIVPNLAVVDVAAGEYGAPDDKGASSLEVTATLANYGTSEAGTTAELRLGPTVVAEVVTLAAGASKQVVFKLSVSGGTTQGQVSIAASKENRLDADDTFYFTVGARRSLQTLIVNGSPQTTGWLDELYFLRAALAATAPGETPIAVKVVQVSELTSARVDASDVVVLANVGNLTKEQTLMLEHFVERGGGVFITAGDQWVGGSGDGDEKADKLGGTGSTVSAIGAVNKAYGKLLPFPVREVKSVGKVGDPRALLASLSFANVKFEHPIFQIFDGLDDASLFKAHVYTHVLVDTEGRPEATVLASLTGGIPALIEAPIGRGRVVFLTTTIDRDWADLALRTSFPPLVQRICAYLARALDRTSGAGFSVGDEAHVPVPEGRGPLVLLRPDGGETPLDAVEDSAAGAASQATTVYVGAPDMAGHWAVMRAGERERAVSFAVNVDRRESDLRPASEGVLSEVAGQLTRDNGILPTMDAGHEGADEVGTAEAERGRTVLWPWILAGLFLLFGSEAWLLVRGT